jgi:hypothetical protein
MIHVIDKFRSRTSLRFFHSCHIAWDDIERQAEEIWSNETKNVYDDSLDKAIQNCIELDNKAGRENGGLSVNK